MADVPESVSARITRLSTDVVEAGYALDGARKALAEAVALKKDCYARFMHLSEELMQAIQEHREHREGPSENAPYQP